ncbi:MAG TPA: sigma-70 family RNA polymerase sigma factor, partial [Verrucomicrobiae bacterium]|nr:sigma-70 family RNA polymerase sigma factor [Verrucomicrobiae bacterium]
PAAGTAPAASRSAGTARATPSDTRVKAGEANAIQSHAFTQLFQSEFPKLENYCRRFTSGEDAREVAQEAFARLCATTQDVHSPTGMLYEIARNLLIDQSRRRRRVKFVPIDDASHTLTDHAPSPEESLHWREELKDAADMIRRMPLRRRKVFIMHVLDQRPYADIADELQISLRAVKKELEKAYAHCTAHTLATQGNERGASKGPRSRKHT